MKWTVRPRKGRPTLADLPERKHQLVVAASSLFARAGYDQLSFAELVRSAGVSTKTIYTWFGGKAGLFRAVTDHLAAQIEPAFDAILESHDGDIRATLVRAAELTLSFALSRELIGFQRAVIGASAELPEVGQAFDRNGPARGHSKMMAFFTACVDRGELAMDDAEEAMDVFSGLLFGDELRVRLMEPSVPAMSPDDARSRATRCVNHFLRLYGPNKEM